MKNLIKQSLGLVFLLFFSNSLAAQDWVVPESESLKNSFFKFEEDANAAGEKIYSSSCASCHGTPTMENYTPMVPSPGDIASKAVQSQTDGDLHYKIRTGRNLMPGFENALSEREIWNLVAYIRSFNKEYTQQLPNPDEIEISELRLTVTFDDNIDKIVVKVTNGNANVIPNAPVTAFVEGMFGNHLIGTSATNELGIAWFEFDSKIPGDKEGNINVLVKANYGNGSAKVSERLIAATPTEKNSAIEGRHLWSKARKAPIWMIVIFNLIGIGVWGAIIYIIFGLRRIKKLQ